MTDADAGAWETLRDRAQTYGSCLLGPDFARITAASTPSARIGFIYDQDDLVAVLPYTRTAFGLARPIGAPFSDYSGPLVMAGRAPSMANILKLLGLAAFRSDTVMDQYNHFSLPLASCSDTHIIRLGTASPEQYLEAQRAAYPKRFKNFRRLERRMEEQVPDLQFIFGKPHPQAIASVLAFKSDQFIRSGLIDVTTAKASSAILQSVIDSPNAFMVGLWNGDELVSAHFGIKIGTCFHPWVAAYKAELSALSPGHVLFNRIILAMPEMGVTEYDLSGGHDSYKKYYSNATRTIGSLRVSAPTLRGLPYKFQNFLWKLVGAHLDGSKTQRLRRRMEHAAICHQNHIARAQDLAYALKNRPISDPRPENLPI
jgi:CelD/BcsL family acetyltransferase involved in cellulose biosynthesis